MKKSSFLVAAMLLLSLCLAACGSASSAPASSAPASTADSSAASADDVAGATEGIKTVSEGKLVMATEATFRPYEYMSGTDIVGVDVDIAQAIADELGLELVIEDMAFDAVIAAVDSGKADFGAAGLSVTPERAEMVDFSIEYASSKQVILTKADSGITSGDDLDGKTVGVQLGTTGDLFVMSDEELYPNATVERYNRYTDAVNDLISGRLDAIVLDSLPAEELKAMGDDLVICEEELFTDVYAICVQKDNTALLDAINTVLQRLMDEGKIEEFTQNHLS